MELTEILTLILLGLLGGFLSGLLGVGGGVIFVPVFDQVFRKYGVHGEELVRFILANSFLAILISGISASIQQRKRGYFFPAIILRIALPATISGSLLSLIIRQYDWYGNVSFKLIFITALLFTLWRTALKRKVLEDGLNADRHESVRFTAIGMSTGLVSALSGLGGGIAMIPLLQMFTGLGIRKASAISIGVIPIMVIPFLVVYGTGMAVSLGESVWQWGYVCVTVVIPVLLGILPGAQLGVALAHKLPEKRLVIIFAALLLFLIIRYVVELAAEFN